MALPELQASCSDGRSGARHVHPFCGRPKVLERLLEIRNDLADWLGLPAHKNGLSLQLAPNLYHVKTSLLINPSRKMKAPSGEERRGRGEGSPHQNPPAERL